MDGRRLLFAVAPVAAAAGLGTLGSRRAPEVYGRLQKPTWAPPAAVFGPVWTALYVSIGCAGWRLYERSSPRARALHLTQLALNAAWPVTFFGIREKRLSLGVIVLLDGVIAGELAELRRDDPLAFGLLLPYAAWSGFATVLNASVSDPTAAAA
jgi:benzodiazapine receptor